MSYPIILPKDLDVVKRWKECVDRNSVMCWRALSHLFIAYARLEHQDNRFAVANDLLTLAELAQQMAIELAPFEDVPEGVAA